MYDKNQIQSRYRAVAFMSAHTEAYEAMQECPTLEDVPIKYMKAIEEFFEKNGVAIEIVKLGLLFNVKAKEYRSADSGT